MASQKPAPAISRSPSRRTEDDAAPTSTRPEQTATQPGPSEAGPSAAAEPSTSAAAAASTFGPAVWQRLRAQWTQATERAKAPRRDSVIASDATYDDLLLSGDPFGEPVPLPEMVEFLIDAWIQDGLYD